MILLSTHTNYTITNLAYHLKNISHDTINRYLKHEILTPKELGRNVQAEIVPATDGYFIFDDTVLSKKFADKIELVRRQYSGNEHKVVGGIGLVNCLYFNPHTENFWIIDYRIYDLDSDGKTKIDHVEEMILDVVINKKLPLNTVLMDSQYAIQRLMGVIDNLGKIYYCPLKNNRLVDDTNGVQKYQKISSLTWNEVELLSGKTIKIKDFPQAKKVKLFWVTVSENRTEFVVTNDLNQSSTDHV